MSALSMSVERSEVIWNHAGLLEYSPPKLVSSLVSWARDVGDQRSTQQLQRPDNRLIRAVRRFAARRSGACTCSITGRFGD